MDNVVVRIGKNKIAKQARRCWGDFWYLERESLEVFVVPKSVSNEEWEVKLYELF